MKDPFYGYYPPTAEQYERLWKEGLIVLDTNVLLNLYRLPTTARDELLTVLELLKGRLWIPHHVALEFQRRRLTVISAERKSTEDALGSASDFVAELKRRVDALQIDKRGIGIEAQPLINDLEQANSKLIDAIKAVHKSQLDIAAVDPIRDRLDEILAGRVGVGPTNQAELDALINGGEERFKESIPPGFADADKEKNPNEATFIHDHLKYQRKFGDLILWRQVLQHVNKSGIKTVLLVTADKKEDWWWREQGKTIGAHPELVREIYREGGVDLFWMYSSVQFVEHATKYTTAKVSSESVAELQQVLLSAPNRALQSSEFTRVPATAVVSDDIEAVEFFQRFDPRLIAEAVASWLSRTEGDVQVNSRGFPDLIVRRGDDVHGYEIKFLRHFDRMLLAPHVVNSMLRGYMEMNEGRLSAFTMIIAISEQDFFALLDQDRATQLHSRLDRLLSRYPISGIIVGAVLGDSFEPLAHERAADYDARSRHRGNES